MSHIESTLLIQIRALDLPDPVCEYRFAAEMLGTGKGLRQRLKDAGLKDWRFDFAYPDRKIAIECEGGAWINGRHNRASGFTEDARKYNAAQRLGWQVYRFTGEMVDNGEAITFIERVFSHKEI